MKTSVYIIKSYDDLTYAPESTDDTPRPLSRVRFFEVADNEVFMKVQGQILNVVKALGGPAPRTMYRKRFMSGDRVSWATVSSYKNWAELDEESSDFVETFKKVNGEDAWETFGEEFDQAVLSRRDQWRSYLPELSGGDDD